MEQYYSNDYLNLKNYLEIINKHFEFIVCDIWNRKRLYMKEDYVLKVCNDVIRLDPISSEYPTLEEYHKSKNNLTN